MKIQLIDVRIPAPAIFSFSRNYHETVSALRELKVATLTKSPPHVRTRVYLDLSTMREISVAGALVLAAEIDRWRIRKRTSIQPRDIDSWDEKVKRTLNTLGFFRLLDVAFDPPPPPTAGDHEIVVLPVATNGRLAQEVIGLILDHMKKIAGLLEQDPAVYAALVEATYNTTLHAYPHDYEYEFPPLTKRWWVTSCWYPKERVVRFIAYDQGVGIPATLPRWEKWELVREFIAKIPLVGAVTNDASSMIEAAIEVSRTSRPSDSGHGKGLKDVISPIDGVAGAYVRILSGRGSYLCYGDGTAQKKDEQLHLGGTLIEWTIPTGVADRQ